MPQKRMSPSGGDKTSATVLRTVDHAICGQLCKPSARSSSMTVCRVHADVGPLGQAHVGVDIAEQGGGRAEAVPVRDGGPLTGLQVLARNAECAVALLGKGVSPLAVRGLQFGRVHLVLPLVPGVAGGHPLDGQLLELCQRRAGQHEGVPGLDVGSGRRPSRGGQHSLQHLFRDRLVGETAHRPSARDCLIYVHDRLPNYLLDEYIRFIHYCIIQYDFDRYYSRGAHGAPRIVRKVTPAGTGNRLAGAPTPQRAR